MVSLKFDADGQAIEWWPLGKSKLVVLNPKRSFGQHEKSSESSCVA